MEIAVRVIIPGNRETASVVIDKSIFLESYKVPEGECVCDADGGLGKFPNSLCPVNMHVLKWEAS